MSAFTGEEYQRWIDGLFASLDEKWVNQKREEEEYERAAELEGHCERSRQEGYDDGWAAAVEKLTNTIEDLVHAEYRPGVRKTLVFALDEALKAGGWVEDDDTSGKDSA